MSNSNWPFPTNQPRAENEVSNVQHTTASDKRADASIPANEKQRLWLFTRLRRAVAVQLGVSDNDISYDTKFVADLGADSLDIIETVMAIEDEFSVEISDEIADGIKSINDAIPVLHEKLSSQYGKTAEEYKAFA